MILDAGNCASRRRKRKDATWLESLILLDLDEIGFQLRN
jgi:hypothetical protein